MANVVITETGPLYSLQDVKQHLRVDHDDDDAIIETYMAAAEQAVLQHCNTALVPLGKEAVFKTAALLAVMEFYDKGAVGACLPQSTLNLINPHRWLRV